MFFLVTLSIYAYGMRTMIEKQVNTNDTLWRKESKDEERKSFKMTWMLYVYVCTSK